MLCCSEAEELTSQQDLDKILGFIRDIDKSQTKSPQKLRGQSLQFESDEKESSYRTRLNFLGYLRSGLAPCIRHLCGDEHNSFSILNTNKVPIVDHVLKPMSVRLRNYIFSDKDVIHFRKSETLVETHRLPDSQFFFFEMKNQFLNSSFFKYLKKKRELQMQQSALSSRNNNKR
jgi:hypothetical protein